MPFEWFEPSILLAMLLVFLGSFVQTSIGFGLAIVSAPMLIMISPDYVPAPISLVGLFISAMSALKYRSSISIGGLKMALIGRIPGSVVGATLLVMVSHHTLSLLIGCLVIVSVILSVLPFRIEPNPKRMGIAGFFSGLFGTSSGIGGPPMALLLQHQNANQLRGNLSAFFMISAIISLGMQIPIGFFSWHHVQVTLPLLPAAWLGCQIALKTTEHIPKHYIRIATLVVCISSGITAIWQGLSG